MPDLAEVTSVFEHAYTRSTGPVIGGFLTGLRNGRLLANRSGDRVLCPPLELDPDSGELLGTDFVDVGPGGVVLGWTWVADPSRKHPFPEPFAFALIRLDGADTSMLHAVRAGAMSEVSTGMRVRAQWRDERDGAITDVWFVAEADASEQEPESGDRAVSATTHTISLTYREAPFPHRRRFIDGLLDGRIIGQRSPVTDRVIVPPAGYDAVGRVLLGEEDDVELGDAGIVVSHTFVRAASPAYIQCAVLLDGADQPIEGIRLDPGVEVRDGMRVQAVWNEPEDRTVSDFDNRATGIPTGVIASWEPTGEPDVDLDSVRGRRW